MRVEVGAYRAAGRFGITLVTMKCFRRWEGKPCRLGVFPGSFNPITVAHLALAEAALNVVDEVVFVLPRQFPHKTYSGASFEQRKELLSWPSQRTRAFQPPSARTGSLWKSPTNAGTATARTSNSVSCAAGMPRSGS